ncbi:hypothetical protein SAMN02927923_02953 [Microvirga guangxiensis]|uniref:Uncharacterized protein n=2 Tax=Microvirga guangxiensis TaxID=549386 RepID=A0A1G5JZR2_9HYPH|nr:hypothetical protein SAMN02927923_02953 [Microvirga guangxiensis]
MRKEAKVFRGHKHNIIKIAASPAKAIFQVTLVLARMEYRPA